MPEWGAGGDIDQLAQRRRAASSDDSPRPTQQDLAAATLRRTGHSRRLEGRDLVVDRGTVVARATASRPARVRQAPPPRTARPSPSSSPAGIPRPLPARLAGHAMRIASAPAAPAVGLAGITQRAYDGGSSKDSATGRILGALVAGGATLVLASLWSGKFFNITAGSGHFPAEIKKQPPIAGAAAGAAQVGAGYSGVMTQQYAPGLIGANDALHAAQQPPPVAPSAAGAANVGIGLFNPRGAF